MKKTFLLLPLTALMLTACSSSNHSAPVENAGGTLTPGIMQPVENNTWEPQVQPSSMPVGMNDQVVAQPVANQAGTYANVANTATAATATTVTATATAPQSNAPTLQQVQQTAQPVTTTKTVCKPVTVTKQVAAPVSQNVDIPRNSTTNAPDYSKIDKGFYKGTSYTVKKGDTMFLIAYIAGLDVKELANLNGMSEPYKLSVGQTLKTSNVPHTTTKTETKQECKEVTVTQQPEVTYTTAANGTQYGSDGTVTGPVKAVAGSAEQAVSGPVKATAASATSATTMATTATSTGVVASTAASSGVVASASSSSPATPQSNIAWQWPTTGKVVQGFSNSDGGNKGVDISGSKGQAVYAAAAGRVVYAGNALRGYGNLIIIKHNDDFLSAYAHNDSISVSDQQQVKAGQQIAKMGSSGTNSVKLHFEIRYKGKSVDPTRYLPKR
ncbi:murein hydrolase activator NlpD [Lonepinella sp. BR2271]|uniref:murein hydrolase activator NlpD n=1 Tax=Lonepinella sp. BR2271 TaxID=3434550 RepID=UPI003F6E3576